MLSESCVYCDGWSPPTTHPNCPATLEEDAALTAMWTLGWKQLPCGVNSQANHYCKFLYMTTDGEWVQTYRYYNEGGSYYYRGSSNRGFYYDPVNRRQYISIYGANNELLEREYLPMEDDDTTEVPVDAFPETPVKVEEREIKIEEPRARALL